MKKNELKFFKKLLEERKEQIIKNINKSADEIAELRSNGAVDDFDVASVNTDSNLEYAISLKQRIEFQKIEKALKKIENGNYGICEECEEQINLERLKAKPHASLCISCREISEKRQ
ncbi:MULTISPECIES: RNA polymerase-binding protein DksA [unclassified Campylobacter]|uniref:RNA polymerase-binding protein DksA n=1 Tax=unclassified Campylobacter TaxID=2593542 RepID=UPI0022E99940|nr:MULTISPECIES: RNA polymerase-binding protein DksA [unclassified Campylobacter]MDA3055473.1 RNA polymerase-binding protein DksA [Campylobacter sp. CN_NA1]MDA3064837.1 RNA polymerase-binding protein DksA [Campylobacter sp. CN_NE4]MDA3068339.1 RNA polymerase-binding protein DksA [Campylobacter sp. CN_NE3]MDA3079165.1 RNA polymerase-binding protein DksA [Campylobacter sp. CS_NA2]MDA3080532.1 RNA polymerase-binding protein DksA [Campylobacter sp. CS_NA1]